MEKREREKELMKLNGWTLPKLEPKVMKETDSLRQLRTVLRQNRLLSRPDLLRKAFGSVSQVPSGSTLPKKEETVEVVKLEKKEKPKLLNLSGWVNPPLGPANDSLRELMKKDGIIFRPKPTRKVVSVERGLSAVLMRSRTTLDNMKPKPAPKKIPFGSSLPRDFSKWQNLANDYSKPVIKPHVSLKKKEPPKQVIINRSPFARPGETRSEELMRVGQAIVNIPCKKRFSALRSTIIRRKCYEALHGEKSNLERAKDWLQDWRDFERRRRPYYHEIEDPSFLPKLSGEMIEKCLAVGVDFGLRRVHSDSDLEPGVYRQRYGKEDMYEGEIIICEKLTDNEVEVLRNKSHRFLLKLLGPANANLTDERLKERVIMLPIEPRKKSLYDPANPLGREDEETEEEIKEKAERLLQLGRTFKPPIVEDEEDLPPLIRQMKRAKP